MPRYGAPGTTYESTQPPLAYVLDGVVYRIFDLAGQKVAFYAIRMVGVLEFVAVVLLMGHVLRRRLELPGLGIAAALLFMALNPMLLAMAGAVQNDMLSLLLGVTALTLVLERDRSTFKMSDGLVVGVVSALAILAKETAWPLALAVPLYWIMRHGLRPAVPAIVSFFSAYAVLIGWWIIRNLAVYHSLLGKTGAGTVFHVHSLSGLWHVVENLIVYLWLPTEYYRDAFPALTLPSEV